MEKIISLLKEKNLTLSSAESFTGGGFANEVTNYSGASNVFKGALVTYTNEIKENVLDVSIDTLEMHGAVSEQCCREMANNAKLLFNTDIAVSFTGNAGPNPSEDKEVGLVFIGFAYKNSIIVDKINYKGDRVSIKSQSISYAINKICDIIKKEF